MNTKELADELLEKYWTVKLCDIAKLHQKADYVVTYSAKEALWIHRGCPKCLIWCPQDRTRFEDSLSGYVGDN
jgi:hypothetical protein